MDRPCQSVNAAPQRPARRLRAAGLAAVAVLALGGCTLFASPVLPRGNRITEDQLKDITVGVHTRNDVRSLWGSPTASSTFGDASWYYISAKTRIRPGRVSSVTDQETVAVDFDNGGVVREIRVLTAADMRNIPIVSRETPTPGNERTTMQALFGNIGRIGTPGSSGSESSPGFSGQR